MSRVSSAVVRVAGAIAVLLGTVAAPCVGSPDPDDRVDDPGEQTGAISCEQPASAPGEFGNCFEYVEYPDYDIAHAMAVNICTAGTLGRGCPATNRAGRCEYGPDENGWLRAVSYYYPAERGDPTDEAARVAQMQSDCVEQLQGTWSSG